MKSLAFIEELRNNELECHTAANVKMWFVHQSSQGLNTFVETFEIISKEYLGNHLEERWRSRKISNLLSNFFLNFNFTKFFLGASIHLRCKNMQSSETFPKFFLFCEKLKIFFELIKYKNYKLYANYWLKFLKLSKYIGVPRIMVGTVHNWLLQHFCPDYNLDFGPIMLYALSLLQDRPTL